MKESPVPGIVMTLNSQLRLSSKGQQTEEEDIEEIDDEQWDQQTHDEEDENEENEAGEETGYEEESYEADQPNLDARLVTGFPLTRGRGCRIPRGRSKGVSTFRGRGGRSFGASSHFGLKGRGRGRSRGRGTDLKSRYVTSITF